MKDHILIVDYDPRWPAMFQAERALLERTVGGVFVAIEHVGSTSVPGLGAKPIIDALAAVRKLDDVMTCIDALAGIGYTYVPEYEAGLPERRYFRKGAPRTHHLHVVEPASEFWTRHLLFRDYVRAHPETAREYERLKRDLAARYGRDRDGYSDAKTEFVRAVEEKARGGVETTKARSHEASQRA